ncbi:hypothetical protein D3C73_437450 [compost metagenome]
MLFHYSEDENIEKFIPKEMQNRPGFPAVVWAIDEEHEYTYFFPRDCPRIVCRKTEKTTDTNIQAFFHNTTANIIVTVESDWYTRIAEQKLFRYSFNEDTFELFDQTAGYYISRETVSPMKVDVVDHLIERLLNQGIELRFTTNLYPLRDAILASDFKDFGIHRFNNAKKL